MTIGRQLPRRAGKRGQSLDSTQEKSRLAREVLQLRGLLATRQLSPSQFRGQLLQVPEEDRDAWLDRLFGLDELPADGPDLPRGCVPYLPSSVDTLLRVVELAQVHAGDVFVDLGSGLGRATALTHFLTGAGTIGVEVQAELVRAARDLNERLNTERVAVVHGDAAALVRYIPVASVFFLYCPFSGARLERVLDELEWIAGTREIRVCTVDLPLPSRPWLVPVSSHGRVALYRSALSKRGGATR